MRVSFSVYGVLYVVVEIVGAQLESIGWPQLTPLDVATAVTDACLTVAVGIAVLVGLDLGGRRWRRALLARRAEVARLAEQYREEQPPIGVPSWRAEPLALTAGPSPARGPDYSGAPSSGRAFPEEPGRLL
ncbi:hypothetical protein [Geodermatophilus sabuli]|uniref:Uncharacterized protein n=1 Tax=Geodermatophilus sabuli TaxID=1564158 RepID=A0A285EAL1_9ACTN|nr:hypothetical protein [Geodermatophilus sabuli]MBB3085463.1 hypothetical protein [Geodermatophilus sabuli]SNX96112.1 hypothetical protein SAMN06893097_103281 [Geodermatophilus sabuli]